MAQVLSNEMLDSTNCHPNLPTVKHFGTPWRRMLAATKQGPFTIGLRFGEQCVPLKSPYAAILGEQARCVKSNPRDRFALAPAEHRAALAEPSFAATEGAVLGMSLVLFNVL